jgi:peptide deformylase
MANLHDKMSVMLPTLELLRIVHYPDPVLRAKCKPVTHYGDALAALAQRMLALMHEAEGVGLAAPQVGVTQRLFVMNHTGQPGDDLVLVNPHLSELDGSAENEEGCLSIPGVRVQVRRAQHCKVLAHDPHGRPFEIDVDALRARIVQHETDHLNGVLILDRMGPSDQIATRKTVRALEDAYRKSRRRR